MKTSGLNYCSTAAVYCPPLFLILFVLLLLLLSLLLSLLLLFIFFSFSRTCPPFQGSLFLLIFFFPFPPPFL